MNNHLHLQIISDESMIHFNIKMLDGAEPSEVLEGAVAENRNLKLKDVKIIWLDDDWEQIVFQADGEQYIGTYQIIDYSSI